MKLERTTFETSRAGEYLDFRQLWTLTGVAPKQFAKVILKESIDNGLDTCEMADVPPEIDIEVRTDQGAVYLTV
jgi:DNA topoisomerase VI subunit B